MDPSLSVTGTMQGELPMLVSGIASPAHRFHSVALQLLPGMSLLAGGSPLLAAHALALVAGHTTECLLKAFISKIDGDDVKAKAPGHDLVKLWSEAGVRGLALSDPPPEWLLNLHSLHARPHHLRYAELVNGFVYSPPRVLEAGVLELAELVREVFTE